MSCPTAKCLCEHLIISQSVTFSNGTLIINIPSGNYENDEKYCIIVAQSIPTTTTIAATVVITIGTGTTQYPLVNSNCTNVNAYEIQSRTRYSTVVHTNIQSGVFQLTGPVCRNSSSSCSSILSLPIAAAKSTAETNTENTEEE
jgi:hypothetical protein